MKGYYKNWYQHYKEEDKRKEQELKRQYFSDEPEVKKESKKSYRQEKVKKVQVMEDDYMPKRKKYRRKRSFIGGLFGVLLPLSTVFGFGFLWYQLDVGPVRGLVDDALVFVGIREESEVVLGYHIDLLTQHEEFVEKVDGLDFSNELNLVELHGLHQNILSAHEYVTSISTNAFDEANRLWGFKLTSVNEMMRALEGNDEALYEVFNEFVTNQTEIANMVREALGIGF